jgi:hypothetical protein
MAGMYYGEQSTSTGADYQGWFENRSTVSPTQVVVECRAEVAEKDGYHAGVRTRAWIKSASEVGGTIVGQADGYRSTASITSWEWFVDTGWGARTFTRGSTGYYVYTAADFYGVAVGGYSAAPVSGDSGYPNAMRIWIAPIGTPPIPTNFVATRDSDNKNSLSWTNPSFSDGTPTKVIERKTDGGAWTQQAKLTNAATSWADTTTQTNHSYTYRIRTEWYGNVSDWVESATLYNTPSAPSKPSAARTSDTGVTVSFANPGLTESGIDWQRSTDGSTWGAATAITGADITSFADNPGGGTFYYRVRNTRGSLVSDWSVASDPVTTITPPAAPTLTSPASGSVISKSIATMRFAWIHNPLDGSAQTAAQIRISTNSGSTWNETIQITGATQYSDHATNWAVNATVTWQVRTKGAHADYGPWSSSGTFRVYQMPQANITSPTSPITDIPITVAWTYSDQSGTQIQAAVSILDESGNVLFNRVIQGAATQTILSASDILLGNNASYTIQVSTTSSTTLTAVSNMTILTDYEEPAQPTAEVDISEALGSVTLTISEGTDPDAPATVSMGVFRQRPDGSLLSLGTDLSDGAAVVDLYPPLDIDMIYIVAAYTASGLASQTLYQIKAKSKGAVLINFGDDIAKVVRDRTTQDIHDAPDDTIVHTASATNPDPMGFYGVAESKTGTIAGNVSKGDPVKPADDEWATLNAIYALSEYRGTCVLRRPGEQPIATLIRGISTGMELEPRMVSVMIPWTKVRADGLAL